MPTRLGQVKPQVEEIARLGTLHDRAKFLGYQLNLRHGSHLKGREPKAGYVDEGVADGEDEVLADAHLQLGGAGIGQGVEAQVKDQTTGRPLRLAVRAQVERSPGLSKISDHLVDVWPS